MNVITYNIDFVFIWYCLGFPLSGKLGNSVLSGMSEFCCLSGNYAFAIETLMSCFYN